MIRLLACSLVLITLTSGAAFAQCPAKPPLQHYTAGTYTECPCFVPGEEAGAVFTPPAPDYPLEVISVSFYWKSNFGNAPVTTEQAINLYNAGLPNPGPVIATIPGPMLTDGVLNNFVFPAPVPIASGPIAVTLEFLNNGSGGNPLVPSTAWDSDGCQAGVNLVKAIPGGWNDACLLGVNGDWVVELVYRPCQTPVPVKHTTWGSIKSLMSGTAP